MQIRNIIFNVQMVVLYVGMAILCGLLVGAIVAPIGCLAAPPNDAGFISCMMAEFRGLF